MTIQKFIDTYLPFTTEDKKCVVKKMKKSQLRQIMENDLKQLIKSAIVDVKSK